MVEFKKPNDISKRPLAKAYRISWLFIVAFLFSSAAMAQPLDKEIQADILSRKIVTLIESGNIGQAVPIFEELEGLGIPLPETVQFYYIQALDKAGKSKPALLRATAYLKTYGRTSKHYSGAVEIVSRLTDVVKHEEILLQRQIASEAEQLRLQAETAATRMRANEARLAAEQLEAQQREEKYRTALRQYDLDSIEYTEKVAEAKKRAKECVPRITEDLNSCEAGVRKREGGFFGDRGKLESGLKWCWDRYSPEICDRVNSVKSRPPERPTR